MCGSVPVTCLGMSLEVGEKELESIHFAGEFGIQGGTAIMEEAGTMTGCQVEYSSLLS